MNVAFIVVILFLALNLGVGLYKPKSARLAEAQKAGKTAEEEISDYYTAGRSISSWIMGLTVAATIISGGSLIATPSLIYAKGLVGAAWQNNGLWYGVLGTAVLGKRFTTLGNRFQVSSIPELLGIRFGQTARKITGIMIVIILFANISTQFSGSARVIESVSGWSYASCIILIGVIMTLYISFGGAKAQSWTNVLQAGFMTFGLVLIAVIALSKLGLIEMIHTMGEIDPDLIRMPGVGNYLSIPRFISYGLCLMAVVGIGQPSAQSRFLATKPGTSFKPAIIYGSIAILLWYPCMYVAGAAAKCLLPDLASPDLAFPQLALTQLHPLLAGICLAGVLGATMSTATALVLTASASITNDIASEKVRRMSPKGIKILLIISTLVVSLGGVIMAIDPPELLMTLSTLATGSMGCAFTPMFLGMAYFPGTTKAGALSGAIVGGGIVLVGHMNAAWTNPLGFHVIGWGLILGTLVTVIVSKLTKHSKDEVLEPFYTDGEVIEVAKG